MASQQRNNRLRMKDPVMPPTRARFTDDHRWKYIHIRLSLLWFQDLFARCHSSSVIRICRTVALAYYHILHTQDALASKWRSSCCAISPSEFYWENQVSVSHHFATFYPATIGKVWATVLLRNKSAYRKVKQGSKWWKKQTLGKKSRIRSQESTFLQPNLYQYCYPVSQTALQSCRMAPSL